MTGHGVSGSLPGQESGVECGGPEGETRSCFWIVVGVENDPRPGPTAKGYMCTVYICKKNMWDQVFVLCG